VVIRPAVVALLCSSAANVAAVGGIAPSAIAIIRHWNLASGSERQLVLERRTYLISMLVALVLVTDVLALLLFVFNADQIAPLFVGAMCAVGTLNVNAYGFPSLIAHIAVFFAGSTWLAVNHVDVQAPDYPLVRTKYALLLGLAPVLIAACVLEWQYFLGMHVDVITSCCSRLFQSGGRGLGGDLAALPPRVAMALFYGSLAAAAVAGVAVASTRRGAYVLAAASAAAFAGALVGIVSFLSLYVYEQPHHHCPFCLLKADYGYVGYALYVPLFVATAAGLAAGAIGSFAHVPSLRAIVPRTSARLAWVAAAGFTAVAIVALVITAMSHLVLMSPGGAP